MRHALVDILREEEIHDPGLGRNLGDGLPGAAERRT
jgi:hypothetical protein